MARTKKPTGVRLMPVRATTDAIIASASCADGLSVEALKVGDVLTVTTENNVYRFTMMDIPKRMVRAEGGIFSTPRSVHLLGSSLSGTGTMVRAGWIGVGYRLAIGSDILLSRTVTVNLNGHRILPLSGGPVH